MIDALILTKDDWANTGWRFFKCLQHIGLSAMMFKGHCHPFCYPEQGVVHPAIAKAEGETPVWRVPQLREFVESAKVVHFTSSTVIDTGADLTKKNVVINHSGYGYRANADDMNKNFNPFVDATIIQMPDLLNLGAKNEHLIYFPVDTDFIQPVYKRQSDRLIIGHFPSMVKHKGTDKIVELMEKLSYDKNLKDRFAYYGADASTTETTIWFEHLKRMSYCDVIIDVFNPEVYGKQYGEWGNTSFEAAAMGKLVITNSLRIEKYHEEYGACALNIANNIDELEHTLRHIISLNNDELQKDREITRRWVERKHSIPATAKRLWDKIYKDFY